jgi:hypothetical protein
MPKSLLNRALENKRSACRRIRLCNGAFALEIMEFGEVYRRCFGVLIELWGGSDIVVIRLVSAMIADGVVA